MLASVTRSASLFSISVAAEESKSETEGESLAFVGAAWIIADCSVYPRAFSDRVAPLKNDLTLAEDVGRVINFRMHIVTNDKFVKLCFERIRIFTVVLRLVTTRIFR